MTHSTLEELGFTPFFRLQFARLPDPDSLVPARVAIEHRGLWHTLTADGEVRARLPGRLRHAARDARDLPAVGDWLALRPGAHPGDPATIEAVLERQTALVRQAAGRATAPQVLAANVDLVFVVTSANGDLSPGRLARYRAAVEDSGAELVVVLNKADLVDPACLDALRARVPRGLRVVVTSALTGDGLGELDAELAPGRTVALVGSSGVGKSTLLNRLLGAELLATSPVRATDDTGRHTTTHRELVPLPSGALLIDTPGVRELALWASEAPAGPATTSSDPVVAFAAGCRFTDCTHEGEPGCAVQAAIEAGELDPRDLDDHHKLAREAAWQRRRQDAAAERAFGRDRARLVRSHNATTRRKHQR